MTTPQDIRDTMLIALANDPRRDGSPLAPAYLLQRAGDILDRQARIQALHGQALHAHTQAPAYPGAVTGASPQAVFQLSASAAVVGTHHTLLAAAAHAQQLVAADPEIARLNERILGGSAEPTVIDVVATEVTRAPDAA